jgi:hypothetical protein
LALTSPDRHGDFIGLALTSVPQPRPHIQINTAHLSTGSLPKVSWVRRAIASESYKILLEHS